MTFVPAWSTRETKAILSAGVGVSVEVTGEDIEPEIVIAIESALKAQPFRAS